MRPVLRAFLAAALATASSPLLAQSNAAGQPNPAPQAQVQPEQAGFFPPKPQGDLSLFRTLPPEAYQPPAPPAAPAQPAATAPLVVVVPPTAESQADREEAVARRAREEAAARMPAPINGAFTGLTDERDR